MGANSLVKDKVSAIQGVHRTLTVRLVLASCCTIKDTLPSEHIPKWVLHDQQEVNANDEVPRSGSRNSKLIEEANPATAFVVIVGVKVVNNSHMQGVGEHVT